MYRERIRKFAFLSILLPALGCALVAPALAQVYAFKGKVTDEQGNPVVGAKISIVGIDIKRSYPTKTDKKGEFYYAGITRGKYKIGVEAEGFQPDLVSGVIPGVGEATNVDFKLKKGSGKLAINMSEEEVKKAQQQAEEAKKQAAAAASVKADFDTGLAALQSGKYDEAITSFNKAIEKDPSQPYVWANLGDAYGKQKNYPKAIESFNKALELKPDDPTLVQNLGNIYAASGDTAKAQEMYTKAASMAPAGGGGNNAAVSYYNLGVTMVNAGKTQEAIEAFKKSIASDPSYAESHYQLGICYIGINKNDDGVKEFKEYLKLVQTGPNADTAKALIEELSKKK
ncbi:MAG TPA: tetratricopeptide repeat protein [Acidobacteriota bacterium]|jgi:tetratricopeptide (TPR) repeat protein